MQDVVWQIVTGVAGVVIPVTGWQFWLTQRHRKEAREEFDKLWDKTQKTETDTGHKLTHSEVDQLVDLKLAPLNTSLTHVYEELRRNTDALDRLRESMQHGQNQG